MSAMEGQCLEVRRVYGFHLDLKILSLMDKHGTPCGDVDQPVEEITREAVEVCSF